MSCIKKVSCLFILLLLFSCWGYGQKSDYDNNPQKDFRSGQELFSNKQYGSAYQIFSCLEQNPLVGYEMRADILFYKSVASLELNQSDAEKQFLSFERAYPEHPKVLTAKYYLAKFYFKKNNFQKCIASVSRIDEYDLDAPEREEYHYIKGYSYFRLNKIDEAKESLRKIRANETKLGALASYYHGFISYKQGRYEDALKDFERIRNDVRFKKVVPAYVIQIYLMQKDYNKVIEKAEPIIKDTTLSSHIEITASLAEAYFHLKKYPKTIETFKIYTVKGGKLNQSQSYQNGFSYYQSGRYSDALQNFNNLSIKEDSFGQAIAYHQGICYLKTNDLNKARNSFQYASKLSMNKKIKEESLINFAKVSSELKFDKEAIETLKEFITTYPTSKYQGEAKELLTDILLSNNNPLEALSVLETINPKTDKLKMAYQKVLHSAGVIEMLNKNNDIAKEFFEKSVKNATDGKTKAESYFWIAEIYYKQGGIDKAQSNYKNFLYVPQSSESQYNNLVNYNIGYTYFKQEDYFYAKNYFSKYLKGEKNTVKSTRITDALLRLADCEFSMKNYAEALVNYQTVIDSKAPEGDYALYQKGMILGYQKKPAEKIRAMKNLGFNFQSSNYNDDALFAIAEEQKNIGQNDEAIRSYESLNKNYPKSPYFRSALLNIGLIYYNMEKDDKALSYFKNIVRLYPYSFEAKNAKKQIENIYIDNHQTDSLEQFLTSIPNANLSNSSMDSLLYASAYSAVKDNNCDDAIKSLSKYITKFPDNGYYSVDAHFFRAECAYKANNIKLAIDDYNFVISRSPNPFIERSLRASAAINFQEGNFDMAVKRYEQLEDYTGSNQNIILSLTGQMRSNYKLNRIDKTIETATKLSNLSYIDDELKTEALYYLGKAHYDKQEIDLAVGYFTKVYQANKTMFGAEALYLNAEALYGYDKLKESEDLIYDINEKFATYTYWRAKGFILLADIYTKKADYFTARNTLESIIENYEGNDLKTIAEEKLVKVKELENAKNTKEDDKE